MTHIPPLVYPEDIAANREWFGEGDPSKNYSECDINEGTAECPKQKHYHPSAILHLMKILGGKK